MNKSFFKLYQSAFLYLLVLGIFSSCNSDSDPIPDGPMVARDILNEAYGIESKQVLDVFLPAGRSTEDTPLLLYIHGGGWIEGSKEEFLQFREAIRISFPQYAFVAINYRLFDFNTNANRFPTQENDVIQAINYIKSKTNDWDVSDQLILAGASAGGHLALLHSYKHQTIGNIKAVIAFFPPSDLISLYTHNQLTQLGLNALFGGNPQEQTSAYLDSSPSNFIRGAAVPTIFFHGTSDMIVPIWQSDIFAEKLKSVSAKYEYKRIENQGHGFNEQTYSQAFKDAADFLQKNLK
ncbi:MAG: acetyl esterase/lipase [Algoriphagus sp.]|jgi:acetyl esterase/lipase